MICDLLHRIKRKLMRLRLRPIRVFCFHQVSEEYDARAYCKPDWMATKDFKQRICAIREAKYTFISLQEAYKHIQNDRFRRKKYAVLTCDDGLKCQAALIPWLEDQQIPLTMFVTVKNLDGKTCGSQILRYFDVTSKDEEHKLAERLYLTEDELMQIDSSLVEIGIHGYEHIDSRQLALSDFERQLQKCQGVLQNHKQYISFYAYPYGSHSAMIDAVLYKAYIIPVYVDGMNNIDDAKCIHREML